MKKILILIVLLSGCLEVTAQRSTKTAIGVLPITGGEYGQYALTASENVEAAFVQAKRFTIVERKDFDAIKKELARSEDISFVDTKKIVQTGRQIGAEFMVFVKIASTSSQYVQSRDPNTSNYYAGTASIAVDIINLETGSYIKKKIFELRGAAGTKEESIKQAFVGMNLQAYEIRKWINLEFPIIIRIYEFVKVDKINEAEIVSITAGSNLLSEKTGTDIFNFSKQKFKVVETYTADFDGKPTVRHREIGRIKILRIEDENFTLCKVTDGGKEITEKMNQGVKLEVISIN